MNDRDELARDLGDALDASSETNWGYSDTESVSWATLDGKWDLRETADHLIASGYRKPRTITTVEELDALPEDSIIREGESVVATRIGNSWWYPTGPFEPNLPVTVLHDPREAS